VNPFNSYKAKMSHLSRVTYLFAPFYDSVMKMLKCIGDKGWNIAFKLSEFSCSCGWECEVDSSYPHHKPGNRKEDHETNEEVI